jgi:hypothetical protein
MGFEVISGLDSSGNPVAARADGNVLSVSHNRMLLNAIV